MGPTWVIHVHLYYRPLINSLISACHLNCTSPQPPAPAMQHNVLTVLGVRPRHPEGSFSADHVPYGVGWSPLLPGHSNATRGSFGPLSRPRQSLHSSHQPLTPPPQALHPMPELTPVESVASGGRRHLLSPPRDTVAGNRSESHSI